MSTKKDKNVEVKQVLQKIFVDFIADEKDNKVTRNNLGFLFNLVVDTIDGKITLNTEGNKPNEN